MKIGVVGAGGVGGYVGGRLAAAGEDVSFLARGEQLAALRQRGLTIESPMGDAHVGDVRANSDPHEIGPMDVLVFAVKLWDTEATAAAIRPMVTPETVVITLQNGIDSVDLIRRNLATGHVAGGAMYITSHLVRPGVIAHSASGARMVVESLGGNPQLAAFSNKCAAATGLECALTDDDGDFLWRKFIALTSFSGATALTRKSLGELRDNPETRQLLLDLIDEAASVARARRPSLPPDIARDVVDGLVMKWPGDTLASMAVDLLHGRPLELRWLSGRVHTLGLELGIPTPSHTTVYRGLILYQHGNGQG